MRGGDRPLWLWWAVGGLAAFVLTVVLWSALPEGGQGRQVSLVHGLLLLVYLLPAVIVRGAGQWRTSLLYAAAWLAIGAAVFLLYTLFKDFA